MKGVDPWSHLQHPAVDAHRQRLASVGTRPHPPCSGRASPDEYITITIEAKDIPCSTAAACWPDRKMLDCAAVCTLSSARRR